MPTRYALIGSGHRAQMYLDAIAGPHADVAELVALLDINPVRREFHRDRVPAFADVVLAGPEQLEDVIREQQVDRVIVTSVDRLHAEHVVRALEAGADVVVEKPLTIDAPSARAIQEAIDRTGRSVVVTFNYRYSPRNTALKQIIASGEIGEVVSVGLRMGAGHPARRGLLPALAPRQGQQRRPLRAQGRPPLRPGQLVDRGHPRAGLRAAAGLRVLRP